MLGWLNKISIKDQYEYDFLSYHTKDLDWFAFIIILSGVNISIMYLNTFDHIQGNKPISAMQEFRGGEDFS